MANCPKCQTRYSGAARLCRNCGGELAPAEHEPGAPVAELPPGHLRVCKSCGRLVPRERAQCEDCPRAEVTVVAPRADGAFWARVACAFHCAKCNDWVKLRGGNACPRCGSTDELPVMFWRVFARHARLASVPNARERFPNLGIDDREVAADRTRDDRDVPQDLVAGPGVPPCPSCGVLLEASPCRCGFAPNDPIPKRLHVIDKSIAAMLAPKVAVVRETGAAALAIACPTCAAPLSAPPDAERAQCKYCGATAMIVTPSTRGASPAGVDATWLLFRP